jgi:hypothetical protein
MYLAPVTFQKDPFLLGAARAAPALGCLGLKELDCTLNPADEPGRSSDADFRERRASILIAVIGFPDRNGGHLLSGSLRKNPKKHFCSVA